MSQIIRIKTTEKRLHSEGLVSSYFQFTLKFSIISSNGSQMQVTVIPACWMKRTKRGQKRAAASNKSPNKAGSQFIQDVEL